MQSPIQNQSRRTQIDRLGNDSFDVLVLGGGISGVSTAHVLTQRGYRVGLIDNSDFASGTSQESSQLIWGGIKYLENSHWTLVNDLCRARNALVREYSQRIVPLRFVYPHFPHDPHHLVTLLAGAYAYWVVGRGFAHRPLHLSTSEIQELIPAVRTHHFNNGFQYYDARMVDSDARLTLDFLFDAMAAGLAAANYVGFKNIRRRASDETFEIEAEDISAGRSLTIKARWIVNTTGVWVDEIHRRFDVAPPYRHLFSKGVHIVLPKIETHERALTCLSEDGRVFFVIPWGEATLVGTTDTPFNEPPQRVKADAQDIEYLRSECEAKFNLKLNDSDILNTKAGLRPLLAPAKGAKASKEDFLSLARSHKVWADPKARITALWGGKYTNCFTMAREIADTIPFAPRGTQLSRISLHDNPVRPDDRMLGSEAWEHERLVEACRRELVVTLEDLLRRRTNIALKVANGGRGAGGFRSVEMERIVKAIEEANLE